jgi:hypothetical protein
MQSPNPISDVYLFDLGQSEGRLTLLSEHQHLLRRFGQLELVDIAPGQRIEAPAPAETDRFCFVLDGVVVAHLEDQRGQSPSQGASMDVALEASQPRGLLMPFGVGASIHSEAGARLLMLSTYAPEGGKAE